MVDRAQANVYGCAGPRVQAAMRDIRDRLLGGSNAGQELYGLWREYEDNATPGMPSPWQSCAYTLPYTFTLILSEARFVKDLDKFDMVLQAYEYEQDEGRAGDLESFFASTRGRFTTAQVQAWVAELESRRGAMGKQVKIGEDS